MRNHFYWLLNTWSNFRLAVSSLRCSSSNHHHRQCVECLRALLRAWDLRIPQKNNTLLRSIQTIKTQHRKKVEINCGVQPPSHDRLACSVVHLFYSESLCVIFVWKETARHHHKFLHYLHHHRSCRSCSVHTTINFCVVVVSSRRCILSGTSYSLVLASTGTKCEDRLFLSLIKATLWVWFFLFRCDF